MAERSVKVDLSLDPSKYIAGARAATAATKDLDKAARDLRRAHDDEATAAGAVKVAEAKLAEVNADAKAKTSQRVAAEESLAKAHRQHEVAQSNLTAATDRFTAAQKRAGDEAERSGKKVEAATEKAAKRTNSAFNALAFTGLTVGLPAAAAIGAAGVTASLSLVAGGFAALGVVGVAKTDAVQTAFTKLKTGVVADVQAMSAPLQGDVVNAIDDVGKAWTRLKPQIATAVQGSAPALRELTGAATDLAENAMPGLITAVQASQPALAGVRTFAGQAGAGLGDFFTNASKGSQGAQAGFTVLGGTVQTLEGRLGSLFANLANASTGPLRSLDVIVDQLSGGLVDMTAKGSGALGVLQGFGTAGSGAATVLHGLLAGVSALPPQVTQFAGALGATNMMMDRLSNGNINIGKGFEGLGGKIKAAEGASGKFSAAIGGLASGAINPAFLAITALGLGLDYLGEKQQKAAQYAAEHRDNVRALTDAIRQDNGVLGQSTNQVNSKALADKNAANNLASFGQNIGTATRAIQGSSFAYDELKFSADATMTTIADAAGITGNNRDELVKLGTVSLETGKNYDQLKNDVLATGLTFDSSGESAQRLTGDQQSLIEQLINGTGAVGEQIKAQRQAHDSYLATEHALTGLTNAQIEARNATALHTQAIYDQQNAALGYRGTLLSTQDAEDKYNKTLKDGKATTLDKQKALLDVERAYAAQEQAAYNAAYAESKSTTEDGKKTDGLKALNTETVKIASKFKKDIPESLQKTIGAMTPLEATAAGATVAISKTGDAVYRLPSGKEIKIVTQTEESKAKLADFIAQMQAQNITMKVFTDTGPATGQVKDWQNTTTTIQGNTTTYTYTDPATHAVSMWKVTTDATGAKTTTFADVDPATGKVRMWKQNTDGTWAQVTATADVVAAETALNNAARPRTATIHVTTTTGYANIGIGTGGRGSAAATGGLITPGGAQRFAKGGPALHVGPGGLLSGPGTGTSDDIIARVSNGEFVVNAAQTREHLPLLRAINNGSDGFAAGGMVQAEDGSWVPSSFYGSAPKGPHAMLTEEGYAKLRAQANTSGIGSLPQILQDQLRTYGGWTDNAVQQAIQSGNAVRQSATYTAPTSSASSSGGGSFTGNLYLSSGEFMGKVRGEIQRDKRQTRRAVTSGVGGAR